MRLALVACILALSAGLPADGEQTVQALRYGSPEAKEAALDEVLAGKAPEAGPALLELLADSKGVLRLKVVRALALVGEGKAVKPLGDLLADSDEETRLVAARGLGRLADPAAVPALTQALGDTDEEVREAATRALGECGGPAQVPSVVARLGDKNRMVCLAAVDALGKLGGDAALAALEGQLGESDPSYKRHVVNAIGGLAGPKVLAHLGDWLRSKDPYLRGFAAEALEKRPVDKELVPSLLGLLEDPVYAVRVRAVEVLGIWRVSAAVPPLLKGLSSSEPTFRWKAVQALGSIGDGASREALGYLAEHDSEPEIRDAAAQALKSLR